MSILRTIISAATSTTATTLSSRAAAKALSDTDAFPVAQPSQTGGSADTLWTGTLSQVWTYVAGKLPSYRVPVIELTGATTLDGPAHNRRILVATTSLSVALPALFGNLTTAGGAFEAELQVETGAVLTLPTAGATMTGPTTITGPAQARLRAWTSGAGVNRLSCSAPTAASTTPTLTFAGISSTQPGAAATVTYNFSNGAPTGFSAAIGGAAVSTTSGPTITTSSGSGATAAGTVVFGMTNPTAGSYSLTAASTGAYAATAAAYALAIAATPTLTFQSVSSTKPGATATLVYAYANGTPSSATLSLDGATAAVASGPTVSSTAGAGATASGTVTWTLTVPPAGTHALAAATTGSYAATAAAYTWTTAVPVAAIANTLRAEGYGGDLDPSSYTLANTFNGSLKYDDAVGRRQFYQFKHVADGTYVQDTSTTTVAGWGTSGTTPPPAAATRPDFASGYYVNGFGTLGKQGTNPYWNHAPSIVQAVGAGTVNWYFWFSEDGGTNWSVHRDSNNVAIPFLVVS